MCNIFVGINNYSLPFIILKGSFLLFLFIFFIFALLLQANVSFYLRLVPVKGAELS